MSQAANPRRHKFGLVIFCGFLFTGCDPGTPLPPAQQVGAISGQDGPLSVTAMDTIVNRYAELAVDASTGDQILKLRSAAPLLPLKKGDLLLVIQMQGASVDTSDTPNFGAITQVGGAGSFEYISVGSVSGDTITVDPGCRLRNSYRAAGKVQVVRVPQVTTLQVAAGASVIAPPWDGGHGGIVAIGVKDVAQIDGTIDVTGRGFRGGQLNNQSRDFDGTNAVYRSADLTLGGEKGESIAGSPGDYALINARYGRGAPANGGGGGDSHNAAGGGGANGNGSGNPWNGQGVMDGTLPGAAAWKLDPGYIRNKNQLTTSSGGGRGGYSFSHASELRPDPLSVPPGLDQWGGDLRREVGGLGGRPLNNDPIAHLYLGGGGGAGDENDGAASAGANGGGLVALIASAVKGDGKILADGSAADHTVKNGNDAAGGGGAGGTVVLYAQKATGISISANGGAGGNQLDTQYLEDNLESEGPGGGGGGGYIAIPAGTLITSAAGGVAGTSGSKIVARFPANGATAGAAGQARETAPATPPICPADTTPSPDLGGGPYQPDMGPPGPPGTRYVGGCSAAGRTAPPDATLWLFGLLLLLGRAQPKLAHFVRRRRGRVLGAQFLVFFSLIASEARAQISANSETFRPAIGPENIITVEGTRTSGALRPMLSALLEFDYHPLRLITLSDRQLIANTVPTLTSLHLMAGLGLTSFLSIAADLPVVIYQDFDPNTPTYDVPNAPGTFGVGDFRLVAKLRFIDNQHGGFGLAFVPQVTFPTGSGTDLRGNDAYTIEPRLALDYKFHGGTVLALNLGFLGRTSDQVLRDVRITSQVTYGLGTLIPLPENFAFLAELAGNTSVAKIVDGAIYSPFEGHIGARYHGPSGFQAEMGIGTGFTQAAPGSPRFRFYASIGYMPTSGPAALVMLSVKKTGTGTGTVTSTPAGNECGLSCAEKTNHYPRNTEVVLTAQPGPDSTFEGWSGPCSGKEECRVTLKEATVVTVAFSQNERPAQLEVEIQGNGAGQVTSQPEGIDCSAQSARCNEEVKSGTRVLLSAKAFEGSGMGGWSVPRCGLHPTCEVEVRDRTHVIVKFSRPILPPKKRMEEFQIDFKVCDAIIPGTKRNVEILKYYAGYLLDHPDEHFVIEGHTDERVGCQNHPDYANNNQKLSDARADSAKESIIWTAEHLLDRSVSDLSGLRQRLQTRGYAATCPRIPPNNPKAYDLNRRTEFWPSVPPHGSTSYCAAAALQGSPLQSP